MGFKVFPLSGCKPGALKYSHFPSFLQYQITGCLFLKKVVVSETSIFLNSNKDSCFSKIGFKSANPILLHAQTTSS